MTDNSPQEIVGYIFFGVFLVAFVGAIIATASAFERSDDRERAARIKQRDKVSKNQEMREAMKSQAEKAARQFRDTDMSLDVWLDHAARRLMRLWPSVEYDAAREMIRQEMEACEMVYPNADFEWSRQSAFDMAEEYAREYGEQYGSNS